MSDEEKPDRLHVLNEALDALRKAWDSNTKYEWKRLLAVETWALDQLPVKFGDRVRIVQCPAAEKPGSGWYAYRECLVPGATATVEEVSFNTHRRSWYAHIRLDKEWGVTAPGDVFYRNEPGGVKRWDNEGDQRHLFCFPIVWLESVS